MAKKVFLTEDSARRVGAVVRAYEKGGRDVSPVRFRPPSEDGGGGFVLGRTSTSWTKGSLATVNLYTAGSPNAEAPTNPITTQAGCVNKFGDIPAGKWVILAQLSNGSWYVIAAEC